MTKSQPNLASIAIDEALTFAIAWKTGDGLAAAKVDTADEVTSALRDACEATVRKIEQLEPKAYGPDAHLAPEEYLVVPGSVVANGDAEPLRMLRRAASLDLIEARQLPTRPLYLYAVAVGDDPSNRAIFIRKANPHKAAKPGRIITWLGSALARVEDPIFILDHRFDLIVLSDVLLVINQNAFEAIFRDASDLVDRYPAWAKEIAEQLPFVENGERLLVEAATRDSRIARRLQAIHERGHLYHNNITIEQIKKLAKREGLDEDRVIQNGRLVFDPSDRFALLKLLNEDLFTGSLSGERFEVDRKSTR